jgi:LysM repeat protein
MVPISATVDIQPETLNVKTHGHWVTAYIELPPGYDVGGIDIATVRLCRGEVTACAGNASVPAQAHPTSVGDQDHDGIPDRMVKFDRQELIGLLGGQTGQVILTVSGMGSPPSEPFAGSDTIRVIDHGCGGSGFRDTLCEDDEAEEEALDVDLTPTPEPQATPTPETILAPEATAQPAAPAPASPAPPDVPTAEYTVRPGESLSDVAAFFGTTVETIVALNGLTDANLVVPGQRLLVPAPPASTAPGQAFTSEYVVQPGENLTDIAARFGTTVDALAAENNLANPSAVRIGDRLRVP